MSQPKIFEAVTTVGQGEVLEFDWGRIVWHVSASLGNSTEMTFGTVAIKAGLENPRHRHPNCDEILHVLAGSIEHTLGDEQFVLNAGETISIPKGEWHNAKAVGHEHALMVICFSSASRETEGEGL